MWLVLFLFFLLFYCLLNADYRFEKINDRASAVAHAMDILHVLWQRECKYLGSCWGILGAESCLTRTETMTNQLWSLARTGLRYITRCPILFLWSILKVFFFFGFILYFFSFISIKLSKLNFVHQFDTNSCSELFRSAEDFNFDNLFSKKTNGQNNRLNWWTRHATNCF